jgi:hypothetical protein
MSAIMHKRTDTHEHGTHQHELLEEGKQFISHAAAIGVGFALMVAGLGMGVTMVLLPIGLPVGLVGVLLFVWGLFGYATKDRSG